MSFILAAQRADDATASLSRYQAYVEATGAAFPRGGFKLATSDWYFNPLDHRCPHDAWLESIVISEPARGERSELRGTSIRMRLLGAYHDGHIEFYYAQVFRYAICSPSSARGLGDWRCDEFRATPDSHLIHEIEWAGLPHSESSRWTIEAADVEFQWIPK